jgi:hypothetical protein
MKMKRENLELAITAIDKIEDIESDLRTLELLEATGGKLEIIVNYDEENTSGRLEDYTRLYTKISVKKEKIIEDLEIIKKVYEDMLETL